MPKVKSRLRCPVKSRLRYPVAHSAMAHQRGSDSGSDEDLFTAAESVVDLIEQLKGAGRQSRQRERGGAAPHEVRWRPDLSSHQERRYPPRGPGYNWRRDRGHGWFERDDGDPREPADRSSGQGWRFRAPTGSWRHPPQEEGNRGRKPGGRFARGREISRLREPGDEVTAQLLVEALVDTPTFSISLLQLMEKYEMTPLYVKNTVFCNRHVFTLKDEMVELTPRIKLCVAHSSPNGCKGRDTCDSIHICPKFVLNWCKEKEACVLGHRWHTDHNLAILKRLSLEHVRCPVMRQLLRRQQQDKEGAKEKPLGVCSAYNKAECDLVQCSNLHVCFRFVMGLTTCSRDNCRLNHDLLSPACCHLLRLHNLPINEAPRDVTMALIQANPKLSHLRTKYNKVSLRQEYSASDESKSASEATIQRTEKSNKTSNVRKDRTSSNKESSNTGQQRSGKNDKSSESDESEDTSNSSSVTKSDESEDTSNSSSVTESESDSEERDALEKGKKKRRKKASGSTKQRGVHVRTKGSSDSSTTNSDSKERAEDRADKETDKSSKQVNKEKLSQSKNVEAAPKPAPQRRTFWSHYLFGDVPLPEICYYSVESICKNEGSGCQRLHCTEHLHWQVKEQAGRWLNLRSSQVTCLERSFCDLDSEGVDLPRLDPASLDSSVSGLFILLGRDIWHADFPTNTLTNSSKTKTLQLRRLCTEPVAGQTIKAATYNWYFLDIQNKWVEYGNVDTAGKTDLVSSITSSDIERHYKQNPSQPISFQNSRFTYVLDFTTMKQTNQSTNVSRQVRRRPEVHLLEEEGKGGGKQETSDLPSHWEKMQEHSRLVTLAPTSSEYQTVIQLLGGSIPATNVIKVERIQNPYKWRALQNRIKEMAILYGDETKVNVQQLFHGTSYHAVNSICVDNFDWRLHGTASGQSFGRGTYFATTPQTSLSYCRPEMNGLKYMFVARVAVGYMTTGNSSMARPPSNPITSKPYDSTCNSATNPTIIVKYIAQEYYPEYLLTFK